MGLGLPWASHRSRSWELLAEASTCLHTFKVILVAHKKLNAHHLSFVWSASSAP